MYRTIVCFILVGLVMSFNDTSASKVSSERLPEITVNVIGWGYSEKTDELIPIYSSRKMQDFLDTLDVQEIEESQKTKGEVTWGRIFLLILEMEVMLTLFLIILTLIIHLTEGESEEGAASD